MAREVTKIELYGVNDAGDVRGFDCASGTKIPKGTILKLTTPRTASASTGTADIYAGVASADKASDDNSTRVGTWQNGILEFTSSGTIPAGAKVITAAAVGGNYVMAAEDSHVTSSRQLIVGIAQKDATAGTRVQVRVNN